MIGRDHNKIGENGCWQDFRTVAGSSEGGRPLLILDRDGVVVEDVDYLHTVEETQLLPGAAEVIGAANRAGWVCGLATNQSGIARGLFGWAEFEAVQQEIDRQLARAGATLDFVLACPYFAAAQVERYRAADHPWRKPNPGMIRQVVAHYKIDAPSSILIGDKVSDLEAGERAGIGTLVHVLTGHGAAERVRLEADAHWDSRVFLCQSVGAPEILKLIAGNQTL